MKSICALLLLARIYTADAQDYFLLPENFFLKKGDAFVCHLFVGHDFNKDREERPVLRYITTGYHWFNTMGTQELLTGYPDSTLPVLDDHANVSGLQLLAMEYGNTNVHFTPEKFDAYLRAERMDNVLKMRTGMPRRKAEREKTTRYIKTLAMAGNAGNGLYQKRLGQKLEIILLQNPYTAERNGHMTAQIFFNDKPLISGSVKVLCKEASEKVSARIVKTDKNGQVAFRLDKAGMWMIRLTHMLPSKDPDADWETFRATYTFGMR